MAHESATTARIRKLLLAADDATRILSPRKTRTRSVDLPTTDSTQDTSDPWPIHDPFSRDDLARRLKTYATATFAFAPTNLNPVTAASQGWCYHAANNTLECELCHSMIMLGAPLEQSIDVESPITVKSRALLISEHLSDCPWRRQPCSTSVQELPALPPGQLLQAVQDRLVGFPVIPVDGIVDPEPPIPEKVLAQFPNHGAGAIHCALLNWTAVPLDNSTGATTNETPNVAVTLTCTFCSRRVGSWTLSKENPLDPRTAHKWYCPWSAHRVLARMCRLLAPTTNPTPPALDSLDADDPAVQLAARSSARTTMHKVRVLIARTSAPLTKRMSDDADQARECAKRQRVDKEG
ncbi:hypothetical protein, variant [Allomyces macrogynus ATCC 38327]|uniref:C3HC-type domain-containing protein n=1 Tax=Allomyces macrogynus (strain ATCC 38327) TaxID=578462 RepID=A0A0L0T1Q1_ALLM3|nr:hypothetical protein, variant [Allomyces macrogynus ATCC 38327]|eukprot:KNE68499.1 hypothetical protein, variant [Allomyces macrogynus ATCC 38327]